MKRLLIILVLLMSLVMAFGADATFTTGTPLYRTENTNFVKATQSTVLLASGATKAYFDTAAFDGNKFAGKDIVISGTVTTNTITNTGTDVASVRPDIYISPDGTNWALLTSYTWTRITTLTVGGNCTFVASLAGVYAPYIKVRWQACVATTLAASTGGITAGGISTVITAK